MCLLEDNVYVADSSIEDAGLGVFTKTDVKKGEIVCVSLALRVPEMCATDNILETYVYPSLYTYESLIALGACSFFNNGGPNALIEIDHYNDTHCLVTCVALRDIQEGEEVLIDYDSLEGETESE